MPTSSRTTIQVTNATLGRSVQVDRLLGEYGDGEGPTLVVTSGLHGNEPAGLFATLDVLEILQREQVPIRGKLIGLAGNLPALEQSTRFIDEDMNRIWTEERLNELMDDAVPLSLPTMSSESREARELYTEIRRIMNEDTGPHLFIDLHTTSSLSAPFIPFDDTLRNRDFASQFPVPGILGIEEFLPGTLLSYLNRYRVVALGYEAGQHDAPHSIVCHRAMLWLALWVSGNLPVDWEPRIQRELQILKDSAGELAGFFEVCFRYGIDRTEQFRMRDNYRSFQPVKFQEHLADNEVGKIVSPRTALIFMPLYQQKGSDGFFLIRRVAPIWLRLSRLARRWNFDYLLTWLPGVRFAPNDRQTLLVDTRIARFLATQIFHLLGYRRQVVAGKVIRFQKRD